MQIIDLSKTIQHNREDPFFMRVKIRHKSHSKAKWMIRFMGLPFRLFPRHFDGWAVDTIEKMGVHSTTHIDAPWHYSREVDGVPSKTIDQVPLDWCFADGIVIDMKHKAEFDPITVDDIKTFLQKEQLKIESGMIVLIKTGRDQYINTKDYFKKGTGMSAGATSGLLKMALK